MEHLGWMRKLQKIMLFCGQLIVLLALPFGKKLPQGLAEVGYGLICLLVVLSEVYIFRCIQQQRLGLWCMPIRLLWVAQNILLGRDFSQVFAVGLFVFFALLRGVEVVLYYRQKRSEEGTGLWWLYLSMLYDLSCLFLFGIFDTPWQSMMS